MFAILFSFYLFTQFLYSTKHTHKYNTCMTINKKEQTIDLGGLYKCKKTSEKSSTETLTQNLNNILIP